jgi:DnaJ-class molecular chaperone
VIREGKMVKADLTRDYYGDLELAPSADVVEIKKQFKKLGM